MQNQFQNYFNQQNHTCKRFWFSWIITSGMPAFDMLKVVIHTVRATVIRSMRQHRKIKSCSNIESRSVNPPGMGVDSGLSSSYLPRSSTSIYLLQEKLSLLQEVLLKTHPIQYCILWHPWHPQYNHPQEAMAVRKPSRGGTMDSQVAPVTAAVTGCFISELV